MHEFDGTKGGGFVTLAALSAQIGTAMAAFKAMQPFRDAWRRAKQDGTSWYQFPTIAGYWGGKDPQAARRCGDCGLLADHLYTVPAKIGGTETLRVCDDCLERRLGITP